MLRSLIVGILCAAWTSIAVSASALEQNLDTLASWMTGSFSSQAQAVADSAYHDIRLETVRIWRHRDDGHWLYVEQATAESTGKPYRQRVYRLSQMEDDLYKSEVFAFPDARGRAGEWRAEEPLADLSPDDLELRSGCAVFLRSDGSGQFTGGTVGRACASKLGGAAYATSDVVVGPGRIESWDRGFDASGVQVWGAEKGAYVFARLGDGPGETVAHADEADAAQALPEGLETAIVAFYDAIESSDVEARIALLADDVLMMPNHWTMTRSKESVAAGLRSGSDAVFKLRDRETLRAVVSGDVAYTVNSYFYTYHPEGESPRWHKTKNVHVWRRGPTGDWRLELDLWNSDVPIAAFGDE